MAHNIFHTGFEFIEDKTNDLVDSAKKFGTDLYVDYKVNEMIDSFTDEFKGPTTITPEMAAEGWKPGLDGVPYNSKLNEKFEPGGIFYDPDVDKNTAIANAVASGEVSSAEAGTTPFELSQDLRQRTPSGTIYNPSMDAYNESSLFNYEGPGGVPEYTYGQGLRTGGAGYGTPPGPNLYYEGQYGEGFVEPGVADTAITLPPITMPAGVPQVPTNNAGNKKKDLTYAETIAEMGIAPGDAPSTLFPGPGQEISSTKQVNMPGFNGMNPDFLVSQADQGPDIGLANYTNNGTVSAADQAIFDAAKAERFGLESGNIGLEGYTNNGITSAADQAIFDAAKAERFNNQANFETANNIFTSPTGGGVTKNPNQETQLYQGIYVDPRTVPEIDLVESNVTYPPSFPAEYGDGNNMSLVTTTDEPYDNRLIMSAPMTVEEQAMGTNPELFEEDEEIVISTPLGDLTQSDLDAMSQNGITMDFDTNSSNEQPIIPKQYGLDEAVIDGYKYITNLFSGDKPSAEEVAESVTKEPSIWSSVMETIAGTAGMGFPANIEPVNTEETLIQNPPDNSTAFTGNMFEYDGSYDNVPGSNAAIDAIISQNQGGIFNEPVAPPVYIPSPVNPPSIFTQPAAPAPVYAAPGGAPGYTSYGPPNMQRIGGRYGL